MKKRKTKIVSFRADEKTVEALKEIPEINNVLRVVADKLVNPAEQYHEYQLQIARLFGEIKLFERQFKLNQRAIDDLQKQNDDLVKQLGENLNRIQFIAEQKDEISLSQHD